MSYIVTRTERGRKMVQISAIDANKMVEDGKADPIKRGVLYIDRALSRPKTQDLDSVPEEDLPLEYETRELKASPKPVSRKRGRPRKPVDADG
jgi:hypothetical protein